jgi:hypothetical protein
MTLDIHLAHNRRDAERSTPKLNVDYHVHTEIFSLWSQQKMALPPLLTRFSDYDADAVYSATDLPSLIEELRAINSSKLSTAARSLIAELIRLSEEAIRNKSNLYFFCD